MPNPFSRRVMPISGPALDMLPVTPNDSTDLIEVAVALYAEVGGAVRFVTAKGFERTVQVTNNSILPVGVRRVLATGTTATGLHAFLVS